MTFAALTGWGKCLPPAILTNEDLSTFLETNDEWIVQRTGMKERRVSHVPGLTLSTVAAKRALACAGVKAEELDLILYGSCSFDEPTTAVDFQHDIVTRMYSEMILQFLTERNSPLTVDGCDHFCPS